METWVPPEVTTDSEVEVHGNENSNQTADIDPSELKASAKVFLTSAKRETLQEALDKCMFFNSHLKVNCYLIFVITTRYD